VLELTKVWYPGDPTAEIWFRGSENRGFKLLPGAYWRKDCDERSLVLSFRSLVPSYLPREPSDDWEWYYLMQHYGLPTRLLDWTESPLVALFFALYLSPSGDGPCVWVMDPIELNRLAQGFKDQTILVPVGTDDAAPSRYWLPNFCCRGEATRKIEPPVDQFTNNAKPLAIFPKRYNPRIVAQRGVFTIHGADEVPIETLMDVAGNRSRIARFLFAPGDRQRLQDDLFRLGLSKTALFPEPQSVAEDLKRLYQVS
jgi:hypothetical protein